MILRFWAVLLLALSTAGPANQHQHSASGQTAESSHHAFLEAERTAIEHGEGFGMALAADRNGYPGPKHILELKADLQLTSEQEAAAQRLMADMKQKAIAQGKELLAAEGELEALFRRGAAEAELRQQTTRIAALRADLRWVHLETHLAARPVLTAEQLQKYHHLRHGHQH